MFPACEFQASNAGVVHTSGSGGDNLRPAKAAFLTSGCRDNGP